MFSNIALSGGAHFCIPFLGFLKAASSLVSDAKWVSGCSGGALVAAAWVLEVPEHTALKVLAKHLAPGIMRDIDVARLLDGMGLVDVESSIGSMCKELIGEGIMHWNTIKLGWPPGPGPDGSSITMQQLSKMTGRNLAIGVSDTSRGFAEIYITPESHPDTEVWRVLCASCAIPFVFTPVHIGDSLFCDSCFMDCCPMKGLPSIRENPGVVDTLMLQVNILDETFKHKKHLDRAPRDIIEFGKEAIAAIANRASASRSPPPPNGKVVTIPRWTDCTVSPLFSGAGHMDVLMAYEYGYKRGKEFLSEFNKPA